MRHRYARCRRSAGVEGHITSERNASEPERSHVRPQAAEPTGPHREGEEPKPMMHGHEKSDSAIVATKPPNKAGRPAAEAVERRAEAKENANRCRTCRTQCRESVSPTPERVRKAEASRQTSEVGAVCRKAARTVLCGGRPVMGVPTAIRHSDQIIRQCILCGMVADQRKQPVADRQAQSQGWRMSQSPSLGDRGAAPCQRLLWIPETKKCTSHIRLRRNLRIVSGPIRERAV